MGTLDNSTGSGTKRKIAFVDVTAYTASQLENYYNANYGDKGWRIVQVVTIGTNRYILAEKEI